MLFSKRIFGLLKRRENQAEPIEHRVVKTRSDFSGVKQSLPNVLSRGLAGTFVVVAQKQRADPSSARAFTRRNAADNEFLFELILDLPPCASADSGLVKAIDALGDDAF